MSMLGGRVKQFVHEINSKEIKMKYLFIRTPEQKANGRGGIGLAFEPLTSRTKDNSPVDVAVAVAYCTPQDSFSKKFCRMVLPERMSMGLAKKRPALETKQKFAIHTLIGNESFAKQLREIYARS